MARTASLIVVSLLACSCQTIVVHYEWSADRRHRVRVIEAGVQQFVERDGDAEPAYRAIGVESLVLSSDGAHLVYPALTASGWEVVHDGRRSRPWRGVGEIALSEDGTHVAYGALDDEGWRVVHDGRLGPIVDAVMANTIALSPDGRRLAWVGSRGGASWVFADGRAYGGFSLVGAPIFSSDSQHLAFVAARGRTLRATLDGDQQQPQFEEIVELRFAPDGRLGYFGLRGDRWYPVVGGAIGPPFELLASLTFSATGRTAYLAKEQGRWHAVVDGERIATHEEIAHRSICFAGDALRFAARDGADWSVASGPKLAAIEALVCAGDRVAYLGRIDDRAVVFEGEREVGRFDEADVPIYSKEGRKLAFIASDGGAAFVQIEERRFSVPAPVFETLAISADGAHFALLAAGSEEGALDLVIDGEVRGRFDFEEQAALVLKNGRAPAADAVRRWVDAELVLHLEETGGRR